MTDKTLRFGLWGLYLVSFVIVALILLGLNFGRIGYDVAWTLALGWLSYSLRVLPRVVISRDGLITATVCLVIFTAGLHGFLRWLRKGLGGPDTVWKPRWTLSIVAVVVLMFASGTAAVGVTHQTGWLLSAKRPLVEWRTALPDRGYADQNLKMIGLAVHNRVSAYDGEALRQPRSKLSWQTQILPYLPYRLGNIDEDQDWDSPKNSAQYRGVIRNYLRPDARVLRDDRGFALSHVAGNVNVFCDGFPNIADLKAGGSQVMLAGEVASGFKAWGDPTNLRDPAHPFDGSPEAFGSPKGGGATVLMMDGSVKFVTDRADPSILRALAGRPIR